MSTTNTRKIEQLVALLHYEMSPERGPSCPEILEDLLRWTREIVLNDWTDEPTDEDVAKLDADCLVMGEYLLRGLIACGRLEDAEEFVESAASSRRECEAKFGMARSIPFDDAEREKLAAEWDACKAAADAADAARAKGAA